MVPGFAIACTGLPLSCVEARPSRFLLCLISWFGNHEMSSELVRKSVLLVEVGLEFWRLSYSCWFGVLKVVSGIGLRNL